MLRHSEGQTNDVVSGRVARHRRATRPPPFVPVALAKDSDMVCTQFDNSVVESAGLLKMDFLGLKTLTLIKDAIKIVK